MPSRKEVEEAARTMFPASESETVLSLLDQYGVHDWERERERVQLGILKLAAGNEAKLLHFVGVAKEDYRDILMWADNPASPEQAAAELERTKAILKEWGEPGASDA